MSWLQLRVTSDHPEFVEEVLLAHGAQAVSFVDAHDEPVLEPAPGATPLWRDTTTLGLLDPAADVAAIEASLRELVPDGATLTLATELVEDQDWVRLWLKDCPPLKFGARLWVAPREKRAEVTDPEAIVVELDPGLAFGTGTHPTTALCLEWLAQQDLEGKSVLDYGCGSGILAIAALKLGAARAVGVDLDPQALTATRANATDNGVAPRLATMAPDDFVPFPADVVVANILANPLVQLAGVLAASVAQGGRVALAGLLERQADEVRAAYAQWLDFDADIVREGWTLLRARCRMPALINYLRISPHLVTAGQPRPEHFAMLAGAGVTDVINLATRASPNFLPDEGALCAAHGMSYRHLPVDWNAPSRADLDAFVDALASCGERHVLVHCALNKRVSAFVYLWRVLRRGDSRASAQADLDRIWQPNPTWRAFIDASLAPEREDL